MLLQWIYNLSIFFCWTWFVWPFVFVFCFGYGIAGLVKGTKRPQIFLLVAAAALLIMLCGLLGPIIF